MQQQKSKVAQQNQNQLAGEVEVIVLQARRAAPKEATTTDALWPYVEKVMKDMGVDASMARHVRRELDAKGVTLGR